MGKFTGILGIAAILLISYIFSNNKKLVDFRLVIVGLFLQILTGIFILKVPIGKNLFGFLAKGVTAILELSREGGKFLFGPLSNQPLLENTFGTGMGFIFVIQIVPTIIFICALV